MSVTQMVRRLADPDVQELLAAGESLLDGQPDDLEYLRGVVELIVRYAGLSHNNDTVAVLTALGYSRAEGHDPDLIADLLYNLEGSSR